MQPPVDEQRRRARHSDRFAAHHVAADPLERALADAVAVEAGHVETQLGGVALEILFGEGVLALEEQVVHLPEGSLLRRRRGAERVRVDLRARRESATMSAMTDFPATHRDLLDSRFATLATLAADGSPELTEVWFLHEDGKLRISLNSARLKTRHLRARPQCSLFILDLQNPYRYVDVRGIARIEPDTDYAFADRVGAKYDSDLRQHDAPGEGRVVVTVEPKHVYAVDMSR